MVVATAGLTLAAVEAVGTTVAAVARAIIQALAAEAAASF